MHTGSTESADEILFGTGKQRRWSVVESNEPGTDDDNPARRIFLRRQSMKEFVMNRKESNCIDGSSLEHLVESHRRAAESCKLCKEDLIQE